MGFRGFYDIQGVVGSETKIVTGTGQFIFEELAVPAGFDRWRVFSLWLTAEFSILAHATLPSVRRAPVKVYASGGGNDLVRLALAAAAPAAVTGTDSGSIAVTYGNRGLLLPSAASIFLELTPEISLSGTGVGGADDEEGYAVLTLHCRPE